MKLSNQTYDFLKFLAIHIIPAVETFWLAVGSVWGLPYTAQIGSTIAALGMLIGGIIGLSKTQYDKEKREEYEGEDNAEGEEE